MLQGKADSPASPLVTSPNSLAIPTILLGCTEVSSFCAEGGLISQSLLTKKQLKAIPACLMQTGNQVEQGRAESLCMLPRKECTL